MLVDFGGDELQLYPKVIVQPAEQSFDDDLGSVDNVVTTKHPLKLALKIIHAAPRL